jgi:hypothetical protein
MPVVEVTPCRSARLFLGCPKCKEPTRVLACVIEPTLKGDGPFAWNWYFKVNAKCDCGWEGWRAVARIVTKSRED